MDIIKERIKEYKNNLNRLKSTKKPCKSVIIAIKQEQLKIKRLTNILTK
tara:strand:+ start:2681 stop:2827 length:147 start_codon:yes stop_codon:yes gene_type:complete